MQITYGAKDFQSGLNIVFTVYNINGNWFGEYLSHEIANTGVYAYDIPFENREEYIVGISEPTTTNWQSYKFISTY